MTRSTLPALVLLFLLVCPAVARPESTTCGEAEVPVARVIATGSRATPAGSSTILAARGKSRPDSNYSAT